MIGDLYYEDFVAGQQLKSREDHLVDKAASIAFARLFDPQPQHIDDEGAKHSVFGELVISGWYTAAITMGLKAQTDLIRMKGGLVGLGLEHVRWPRPTKPGDTLRIVVTVIDKRPSESQPGKGVIRYTVDTFNQRGEIAMTMRTAVIAPLRDPAR